MPWPRGRGARGRRVPVGLQLHLHGAQHAVALAVVERVHRLKPRQRVLGARRGQDLGRGLDVAVAHPAVDVDDRLVVGDRGGVQQRRGELLRRLVEVLRAGGLAERHGVAEPARDQQRVRPGLAALQRVPAVAALAERIPHERLPHPLTPRARGQHDVGLRRRRHRGPVVLEQRRRDQPGGLAAARRRDRADLHLVLHGDQRGGLADPADDHALGRAPIDEQRLDRPVAPERLRPPAEEDVIPAAIGDRVAHARLDRARCRDHDRRDQHDQQDRGAPEPPAAGQQPLHVARVRGGRIAGPELARERGLHRLLQPQLRQPTGVHPARQHRADPRHGGRQADDRDGGADEEQQPLVLLVLPLVAARGGHPPTPPPGRRGSRPARSARRAAAAPRARRAGRRRPGCRRGTPAGRSDPRPAGASRGVRRR